VAFHPQVVRDTGQLGPPGDLQADDPAAGVVEVGLQQDVRRVAGRHVHSDGNPGRRDPACPAALVASSGWTWSQSAWRSRPGCPSFARRAKVAGMATRLVHMVIDAHDTSRLAKFWAAALGWQVDLDEPDEAGVWPAGFDYPGPSALPLVFVPVPEPKTRKNRVHLDLATESTAHQQQLVTRLRDLGASPADIGQGDVPWVVLADPEGNEFCVLDPRPVYRDTGPVAAVVVDSANPAGLASFWALAGGWTLRGEQHGVARLRAPQGVGPYLEFVPSSDAKKVKNRVHLDVAPHRDEDHAAATQVLLQACATPADVGQGNVSWAVLADPEGNEFCVLSSR
jgi:Glyoxalase-like domain